MSIQAADLRKLLKIVRQYEVIYGGGISSSDAAIREECEFICASLEKELKAGGAPSRAPQAKASSSAKAALPGKAAKTGKAKRRGRGDEDSLPSLVEASRAPKAEKAPRPLTARASELAGLTSRAPGAGEKALAKKSAPPSKAEPKGKTVQPAAASAKAPAKGAAKVPAKPAKAPATPVIKEEPRGRAAASQAVAAGGKARQASPATQSKDASIAPELFSRPAAASRAAAERATKALGPTRADAEGGGSESDPKRRFAALHLFDAFSQNKLPKYGGFIVCVRFSDETGYTVVEIIGYENLQDIYPDGQTLVFKSVGCKLYAIIEPSSYLLKSVEPVNRPSEQMVPYRFAELLRITTKRFQSILVGRKPVFMPTSFSVFKPAGEDLAVLFYDIADVYSNIQDFLIMLMRDRMNVPIPDARKAGEVIARGIREFRLWLDEA